MALFKRMRYLICLAGVAAMAVTALGQQEQKPAGQQEQKLPTYKADVNVVNVLATVRDKHGKIVNDLEQKDFTLEEDGRPQTIRYFTRETDLPLTLGLLVDTSRSQRLTIDDERGASGTFVDQILRADKDSAFLIHFDQDVELLQDLTKSPLTMDTALSKLELARPELQRASDGGQSPQDNGGPNDSGGQTGGPEGNGGGWPEGQGGGYPGRQGGGRRGGQSPQMRASTVLYDAVFLASDEVIKKQQGRKALVVLSDGVDHGSKVTLERAIQAAQRADTIVYTVYFKGEEPDNGGFGQPGRGGMGGPWGRGGGMGRPGGGYPGAGYPGGGSHPQEPKVDGKKILERISAETGGRMFEASKKEPIDKIYQEIEEEMRNQYSLGYTPNRKADATTEYHKIQLTTKKKDLVVVARAGYYSTVPLEAKQDK